MRIYLKTLKNNLSFPPVQNHLNSVLVCSYNVCKEKCCWLTCSAVGLEIVDLPCASLGMGCNPSSSCRCLYSVFSHIKIISESVPWGTGGRALLLLPSSEDGRGILRTRWPNSAVEDSAHYFLLGWVILCVVTCSHLEKKKVEIQQCNTLSFSSLKKFFWKQKSSTKS